MQKALNIKDILSRVRRLDKEERLILLENLVALIRKEEVQNKPATLSKIAGIGSKLWQLNDIDEYIDQERTW